MVNEEKVILMTRASLFEEKERKKKLKTMNYFRHDYISVQILIGWLFSTISFLLCVGLWVVINMEYLLNNIHKMDLKGLGMTILFFYVLTLAVYTCMLYGVYAYRYHMAKTGVGEYAHTLHKISAIYAREEKGAGKDSQTEERRYDSFT